MDMKEWIASLPGSPRPTPAAKAAGIDPDIEGVSIDEALEIATNKQIRDEVIRRIKVD